MSIGQLAEEIHAYEDQFNHYKDLFESDGVISEEERAQLDRIQQIIAGLKDAMQETSTGVGSIKRSVGKGGKNNKDDVLIVQRLLVQAKYSLGTSGPNGDGVDGDCGKKSKAAISDFQKKTFGWKDGKVEPGGKTWEALSGQTPTATEDDLTDDGPSDPPASEDPLLENDPTSSSDDIDEGGHLDVERIPYDYHALQAYLSGLGDLAAQEISGDLAVLQDLFDNMDEDNNEEVGTERDELVDGIEKLRTKIANLDSSGLPAEVVKELQARLYNAIAEITPFYYQSRNTNLLEGESTRTCNLTSLAMALEQLGKSADDYSGKREQVLTAARVYSKQLSAAKFKDGKGDGWEALDALRLSDFLQFAAIAEKMPSGSTSSSKAKSAQKKAWKAILSMDFMKKLVGRFGVSGEVKTIKLDPTDEDSRETSALTWTVKKSRRQEVTKLAMARKAVENAETEKGRESAQKKYDRLEKELGDLSSKSLERRAPLEAYRDQLKAQIGGELDRGSAVVVLIKAHYVRLQAINDDHVIVDDPGGWGRSNLKVTYEEARAMAYFAKVLILR